MAIFLTLAIIAAISMMVGGLVKLGQIGHQPQAPYTTPEISGEEYIPACGSGGHKANRKALHAAGSIARSNVPARVRVDRAIEVETDQPIAVPNWPVKVSRQ
jgi:hypothetical protein